MLAATFFGDLAANHRSHARHSDYYRRLDAETRRALLEARPAFEKGEAVLLAEFGPVTLPYVRMGAIDSIDLFGLDELIMFAYYLRNRGQYRQAADIGANLGLHSILLAKCGIKVDAYEPDPKHFGKLQENLRMNGVADACTLHMSAVSDKGGTTKFVRVLGNTTSSHIFGAKPSPYGDLEYFDVPVEDVRDVARAVDFMKIDAEGHEAVILKALPIATWGRIDAFVEIGSAENARQVFDHFDRNGVNMYSQKQGWERVERIDHMPANYKEGGIFVSAKSRMNW
jgi:FkbM family methyltransferase